jgi:hypothetical protein
MVSASNRQRQRHAGFAKSPRGKFANLASTSIQVRADDRQPRRLDADVSVESRLNRGKRAG